MKDIRQRLRRETNKVERRQMHSYLYSDGTLVDTFEEYRGDVKLGETVDLTLGFAKVTITASYDDGTPAEGRIIFAEYDTKGMIALMRGNPVVVSLPSSKAGSENTRNLGITVGYLKIIHPKFGKLTWMEFGNLIGTEYHTQVGSTYLKRW